MKIKSITNWQSKEESKLLLWFTDNRKLTFEFFDNLESLKNFVKYYKITGIRQALKEYKGA